MKIWHPYLILTGIFHTLWSSVSSLNQIICLLVSYCMHRRPTAILVLGRGLLTEQNWGHCRLWPQHQTNTRGKLARSMETNIQPSHRKLDRTHPENNGQTSHDIRYKYCWKQILISRCVTSFDSFNTKLLTKLYIEIHSLSKPCHFFTCPSPLINLMASNAYGLSLAAGGDKKEVMTDIIMPTVITCFPPILKSRQFHL